MKVFSETLSVVNKCFPSIPSRKRTRPDALTGDRSSGLLLNRAPMGAGVGKMGIQTHSLTNVFDFEQQKVEERGKNIIPNKRTRTSMVDQRVRILNLVPYLLINLIKISVFYLCKFDLEFYQFRRRCDLTLLLDHLGM